MKKNLLGLALLSSVIASNAFALGGAGDGTVFTLINNSSYLLTRTSISSYQMDNWYFPDTIQTNSSAIGRAYYTSYFWTVWKDDQDDTGSVTYQATCKNGQVESINLLATIDEDGNSLFQITTEGSNCVIVTPRELRQFTGYTTSPIITFGNNT